MNSELTPEQTQAIRQHLAKPRPYNSGCGCMGPRPIDRTISWNWMDARWQVKVTDLGPKAINVIKVLRDEVKLTMDDIAKAKRDNFVDLTSRTQSTQLTLVDKLRAAGATAEPFDNVPPHEPRCPCMMAFVEEVNGSYYEISERRLLTGIEIEAKLLGPIGGPYLQDSTR